MRSRDGLSELDTLKIHWRRWVDIVELFARRRPRRGRVDPREYAVLHRKLTQECRTLAESASEADGVFYRNLEEMVQPWLTMSVLGRADREILVDLLARCRQVDRQLGVRSWLRSVRHRAPRALGLSSFAVAAILFIATIGGGGLSVLGQLRGWSDDLWFAVKRSSDVERLFFVGLVLIIVSIFTVSRTAQS